MVPPDATATTRVKVGLLQPATRKRDLEHNLTLLESLATQAARRGACIACTPECMLDGYSFDDPEFQADPARYCIEIDGSKRDRACRDLAKRLGIHLIVGMSTMEAGTPPVYRNAAVLYDAGGQNRGIYFKMHSTSGNLEASFYKAGEAFPVFDVNLDGVETRIGIMICYDRQIPEVARALRVNGAEIIFNPSATNNFARGWNTRLLQTRAYENKCFVVSINHALPRLCGRSMVANSSGSVITRLAAWQQVRVVELDLDAVRSGEKDVNTRRPAMYGDLVRRKPD
ncbi:MAG: carbon-nitrogen hydrolase family protein [Candidatus Lokiarchaeota archaeon]|nr:carbon-nitrogen hydrolase family protein [Candidatus Lokiarchaeota archaeon]